jgi:NAD(P)-dependent dehydrogenase (short-subunit alcohol dehydrogenase family)
VIILITGATDGLGRALANRLAAEGHTLILHGRDAGKLAELRGDQVHTVRAELADLAQVRKLAAEVRDLTDRLDVFVSNAGIGSGLPAGRTRQTSVDGHELRFAVNYLAGFLLTLELLPLLRASAPARIVNVASLGQHPLDFADLMVERGYSGPRAYSQSKLAQIMSGFELASRVPAAEVTVNGLHPGTYMPTKIVVEEIGHTVDTLETGVDATARLAVGADVDGVTGRFFDRMREARADGQAYDPAVRRELWRRSLELVAHPDID